LFGKETIDKYSKLLKREIAFGELADNITTEGMEIFHAKTFDRFISDKVDLEVTQIGKENHGDSIPIYEELGNYLEIRMREVVFCRVKKGGIMTAGDVLKYYPKVFKVLVITLSDRASKGEYEDRSGPRIKELTKEYFKEIDWRCDVTSKIIPDDKEELKSVLQKAKEDNFDVIFTSGGTGISHRDITPEVVTEFLDKEIPGIMEIIRIKYGQKKPNALLSRGVAGVAGDSLVYALPGSVKAVNEYLHEIFKTLKHLIFMLHGIDVH
jgi:molybdenum cofactor synthesis domain-containing protein